jgi:PEP-CTERM motif
MRLLSRVSAILVLSASTLIAHADSIYTYTGQDFTSADGKITTNDFISGSITTTNPLGDNLDFVLINPVAFSFSDGVDTIDNANASAFDLIQISTNASGAIVDWHITLSTATGDVANDVMLINGGPNLAGIVPDGDTDTNFAAGSGRNSVSGVFTSAASVPAAVTPEPSTLALLGTGILGAAGMMRRRFLPQA